MNYKILLFLPLVLSVIACEEVIDIELDEAEIREVVEATLDGDSGILEVRITTTGPYFEAGSVQPISGATVEIQREGDLNVFMAEEQEAGFYRQTLTPEVGATYVLRVTTPGGGNYEARSTLLERVEIQEIIPEFQAAQGPRDEGYNLTFRFQDPAGSTNFYRVLHSVNQVPQLEPDDLQINDDNLFDGGLARLQLFRQTFDLGDTVTVELRHLDQAGYDYFNSLGDIVGGGGGGPNSGSAAPGNPTTNWNGGALGYFSAYFPATRGVVITE